MLFFELPSIVLKYKRKYTDELNIGKQVLNIIGFVCFLIIWKIIFLENCIYFIKLSISFVLFWVVFIGINFIIRNFTSYYFSNVIIYIFTFKCKMY